MRKVPLSKQITAVSTAFELTRPGGKRPLDFEPEREALGAAVETLRSRMYFDASVRDLASIHVADLIVDRLTIEPRELYEIALRAYLDLDVAQPLDLTQLSASGAAQLFEIVVAQLFDLITAGALPVKPLAAEVVFGRAAFERAISVVNESVGELSTEAGDVVVRIPLQSARDFAAFAECACNFEDVPPGTCAVCRVTAALYELTGEECYRRVRTETQVDEPALDDALARLAGDDESEAAS